MPINDNLSDEETAQIRRADLSEFLGYPRFDEAVTFDLVFRGLASELRFLDDALLEVVDQARESFYPGLTVDIIHAWAEGKSDLHFSKRAQFFKGFVRPALRKKQLRDSED